MFVMTSSFWEPSSKAYFQLGYRLKFHHTYNVYIHTYILYIHIYAQTCIMYFIYIYIYIYAIYIYIYIYIHVYMYMHK